MDKKLVEQIAVDAIKELTHYFLVSVDMNIKNNAIVILYDADGIGVRIDELAKINREIRNTIDEANYFPEGNYSLEISSFGLEKPLLLHRQYKKNIGRLLKVTIDEGNTYIGELKSVSENEIVLSIAPIKKTKKPQQEFLQTIPFKNILNSFIEIQF